MTPPTRQTITAPCPGCDSDIFFNRKPQLGEFVTCPECGDLVEVVDLSPLTLDWSADFDEDDDWSDEWDDEGTDFDDDDMYEDFDEDFDE